MLLLSNTQVPPFSQGQAVGKEFLIYIYELKCMDFECFSQFSVLIVITDLICT